MITEKSSTGFAVVVVKFQLPRYNLFHRIKNNTMTDTIPSERSDYFLFLDYETTGELDHRLLEVAWMLTNVNLEPLFECRSEVIHQDSYHMSDDILKMHTKNGLLAEVANSTRDVRQAECLICDSYQQHIEFNSRVTLAGFTCHFDRGLMKRDMPKLDRSLHYRHFDISVPRGMYSNWVEKLPSKREEHPHRAKADVEASWKIANTYKVLFETLLPRLKDLEGMML
jgi:oligoribonuclease